jgi:hypothetical protein
LVDPRPNRLNPVLSALAPVATIAAGSAVFLYVIGGAVLWLRFDQADVPATRAVALSPGSRLIVASMTGIVAPTVLMLAIATVLLAFMTGAHRRVGERADREEDAADPLNARVSTKLVWALLGLLLVILGLLFVPPIAGQIASFLFIAAWAGYLFWTVIARNRRERELRKRDRYASAPLPVGRIAGAFLLALSGALLAIQTDGPSRLEPVQIRLDRSVSRGSFIAQTGDAVYIGQRGVILGIPNDRVELIRIGSPSPQPERHGVGEQAIRDWLGID